MAIRRIVSVHFDEEYDKLKDEMFYDSETNTIIIPDDGGFRKSCSCLLYFYGPRLNQKMC